MPSWMVIRRKRSISISHQVTLALSVSFVAFTMVALDPSCLILAHLAMRLITLCFSSTLFGLCIYIVIYVDDIVIIVCSRHSNQECHPDDTLMDLNVKLLPRRLNYLTLAKLDITSIVSVFEETRDTKLICDNHATLHIALNPIFNEWTKHKDRLSLCKRKEKSLLTLFTETLKGSRIDYNCNKLDPYDTYAPA
ncbi:hypothetical protein CR513_53324, partial [Mucuna pruriens]